MAYDISLTGYEKSSLDQYTRDALRGIAIRYGMSLNKIIESKTNKNELIELIKDNKEFQKANPNLVSSSDIKPPIGDVVRKNRGNKSRSTDWYTNELMNLLLPEQKKDINEEDTGFISVGNVYFFLYSAKFPQNYKYWDQHPLVYILDIKGNQFFGANFHYITPQVRSGFARSLINKNSIPTFPKQTLHNYIFSGVVSGFMKVSEKDLDSVVTLPTEKFVDRNGQPVNSSNVWS
jgi:hypothetical protein